MANKEYDYGVAADSPYIRGNIDAEKARLVQYIIESRFGGEVSKREMEEYAAGLTYKSGVDPTSRQAMDFAV